MALLQNYTCLDCGTSYEFLHHPADEPAVCPACGSHHAEPQLQGGHIFTTIVPTYPGAKAHKAGYVHQYVNRPAEKISVSVPQDIKR